ncbi:MAG: hypothetical protein N3A38_17520, partial [Planctomycetota bacterium]|nr:hypothetical protein [Planctomycetota bacterium]
GKTGTLRLTGQGLQMLQGALLGPGTLRNEGLLRIGPSEPLKYVCATVENVATVRLEGGNIYFGCTSPNIPGVLRTTGQGVVELVGAHVHPAGVAQLVVEGSEAVLRAGGNNRLNVGFTLKETTLRLEGQGARMELNANGRFEGENRLEVGEGTALVLGPTRERVLQLDCL